MAAVSVTSTPMQRVSGRFSACMGSTRRASNSSGWPAVEKARAMAAPIPADAPVITTRDLDMEFSF